jgi:hypothetical protein
MANMMKGMPQDADDDNLIEAAWPIDPLYDTNLGELMSIAKSLAIAIQEIRNNRVALADAIVTVTIFNDGDTGLKILNGKRVKESLWRLVRPVVHLIDDQTNILSALGPTVRLFFRWVPGHHHNIGPHQRADHLARMAQETQRAYSLPYGNYWSTYVESPTIRWLKEALLRASIRSARIWPKLAHRLRHPRRLPANNARARHALRAHLDTVLPLSMLGRFMPAQWSDCEKVTVVVEEGRGGGRGAVELSVPVAQFVDTHRVFINDGVNSFAVLLENPDVPQPTTDLVLYKYK